ncbi:uncharacterized protein I206_101296 [Kwoniella pini CBS 10737]|uniref:Major facilitator superfamily (MFS) profile domain-containing protein n=1 Tax=Kwoniella pini CBS 10737 TaxID=1296096 RepID=A0A1B9IBE6_9TREE|nr:uncharacterized protein I206_00027 [Kwoniella pini CBS 10737]OCF52731.1 hypothetical protein I206_00027 [Kwoniella pini CBS 10737]
MDIPVDVPPVDKNQDQQIDRQINHIALSSALRKLDLFLLPIATIAYFLNFLDRSNIGNAKAAGLQTDLKLTNRQYSIALTVTYVPYIVAELPLTLAMKRVGPHILIPTLVVSWGIVTLFQGFVNSYGGLIAARFFLGLTEGAILPGLVTYLSSFYHRQVLGKRLAFFFSATSLAGAFSGLLASAILNMEGVSGKRGWQWIFILEGLLTVVCGAITFFVLPRDLSTVKYLNEEERNSLMLAHDIDGGATAIHERFSLQHMINAMKSPQLWLVFAMFFGNGVTLYSLAYFAPTIVQGLGYKGISTQLHSVPPYACSAFVAVIACFLSDKIRHRGSFIVAAAMISIIGYAMFLGSTNHHTLYASLFLQVIGAYTMAPLLSTWMPNNLAPYYTRVTGIAFGFISTNSGGILSTWLFPTTDAPRYKKATWTAIGLSISIVILALLNSAFLASRNKSRSSAIREDLEESTDSLDDLGDKDPRFRYIT